MADEHLKDLTRRFYDEVFNQGNLNAIDKYVSKNLIEHEQLPPGTPPGSEGLRHFLKTMRTDFPDFHIDVQDMTVDGDKVWVRSLIHGTNKGEFMGIPVTGRNVNTMNMGILRFEGDKLVEHWGLTDMATMMQQLGLSQSSGAQHH